MARKEEECQKTRCVPYGYREFSHSLKNFSLSLASFNWKGDGYDWNFVQWNPIESNAIIVIGVYEVIEIVKDSEWAVGSGDRKNTTIQVIRFCVNSGTKVNPLYGTGVSLQPERTKWGGIRSAELNNYTKRYLKPFQPYAYCIEI